MDRNQMQQNVAQIELLKECQREFEATIRYDSHNDHVMEKLVNRIKKTLESANER